MSAFFHRAPVMYLLFSGLGIVILADHGSNKLEAFARVQLPALVVSCKCDAPQRQINPNSIEQVGTVSGYETMQTSAALPDSQKKCVNVVLSMIIRKNGLCPSLLLFMHLFTVAWRLLLCAGLHFACFSAKLDNDFLPWWRNVCFVSVASTTFLIRYLFFYLVTCTCGKGDSIRWRIISLGLAGEMLLSFALSSCYYSFDASTPTCVKRMEFVKGQRTRIFVNGLF